jgi:hypothetical protein
VSSLLVFVGALRIDVLPGLGERELAAGASSADTAFQELKARSFHLLVS